MTVKDLLDILYEIKGGPRLFAREGIFIAHEMAIPIIWISFHRQVNRQFAKGFWGYYIVPASVFLIFTQESHAFLKSKTSDNRVLIEKKNTNWTDKETATINRKLKRRGFIK